jgi:ubiquitin-protein ligase
MSLRLKRLQSDYEAVKRLAQLHPRIEVEGVSGNPPDRYRLKLTVRSLREKAGAVIVAKNHRLEITLPHGYPRDAPICRMLTPVFHPNIAPHAVCIGDHWSAAESLDSMIQRVGEMLAFQSYNVKSPLNGRAAQYVEQNPERIPLEEAEFLLDLSEAPEPENAWRCANCGIESESLEPCGQGHEVCPDCSARCETCGAVLCLACGTTECACKPAPEPAATEPPPTPQATATAEPDDGPSSACANCGNPQAHAPKCSRGHWLCDDCSVRCDTCERHLCVLCREYPCEECRIRARAEAVQARRS